MAHALPDPPGPTIFTVTFWADAVERIAASAAASALASIPVVAPYTSGIDLRAVAIGFGVGALVEFFRCLAASRQGNDGTASMTRATKAGVTPRFVARLTGGSHR